MPHDAELEDSFAEYVGARWPALFRTSLLLTGDRHEAEDILQETLTKAFAKWQRVRSARSVDAYVRKMLLNELFATRRSAARRRRRDMVTATGVGEHAGGDNPDERLTMWAELSQLPPRQRAVLVLRYYEDLTEHQIAEALGCSPGTVKSQAHDALKALRAREHLAPGPDEEATR